MILRRPSLNRDVHAHHSDGRCFSDRFGFKSNSGRKNICPRAWVHYLQPQRTQPASLAKVHSWTILFKFVVSLTHIENDPAYCVQALTKYTSFCSHQLIYGTKMKPLFTFRLISSLLLQCFRFPPCVSFEFNPLFKLRGRSVLILLLTSGHFFF